MIQNANIIETDLGREDTKFQVEIICGWRGLVACYYKIEDTFEKKNV